MSSDLKPFSFADTMDSIGRFGREALSTLSSPATASILGMFVLSGTLLALPGCKRESGAMAGPTSRIVRGISPEQAKRLAELEAREELLNQTVWRQEMMAEDCGRVFEQLWDSINAASNKLEKLAAFPIGEIVLGKWDIARTLPHDIEVRDSNGSGQVLNWEEWQSYLQEYQRRGWQLAGVEFRHQQFDVDRTERPSQSRFYFAAHLTNAFEAIRAQLNGELVVDWGGNPSIPSPTTRVDSPESKPSESSAPALKVLRINASALRLLTRRGAPPFQLILKETMLPIRNARSIDPLILYDLDGDGLSEIVLAGENLVYHRTGEDQYESHPLCRYAPGPIYTALIADFDGDGIADFLCEKYEGLFLFKGSIGGKFDEPGRLVWGANRDVQYPMVLTCGDIDRDGDLDIFLAQYKLPYEAGQMPTPYFDANDGYPAFLLLNDGHGNFSDGTKDAGLLKKRWRRSYSASFADIDGDGNLDLIVVSDFAGMDVYRNDGHGHFADLTDRWISEPHSFGMAHVLADFNADGRLDLFTTGMPSITVDRLEHLQLWRPATSKEEKEMRVRMAHGNRLYLAKGRSGFDEVSSAAAIARSGWSWGCSALDVDNDGFPDIYIANGMESRDSVRDYEGEIWLHDSHVGNSTEDPVVYAYLKAKVGRLRSHGESYGGYEKNKLFINQSGRSFLEAGHLFGVALDADSRNVVDDDLDGDGRQDLIVASYEPWPDAKQTLRVYRNGLPDAGNWIGFQFSEGTGQSPVGVQVTVYYGNQKSVRQIVTGDSYRSQHANLIHFGVGTASQIAKAEIRWPNGRQLILDRPEVNRYHRVKAD